MGVLINITTLHVVKSDNEDNKDNPDYTSEDNTSFNDKVSAIVGDTATVMGYCKKATDDLFGNDPKYKDSIGQHCNSLFIEVCKRL